jgi:hypothetical protein
MFIASCTFPVNPEIIFYSQFPVILATFIDARLTVGYYNHCIKNCTLLRLSRQLIFVVISLGKLCLPFHLFHISFYLILSRLTA